MLLSAAGHLLTDGKPERVRQVLGNLLRSMCAERVKILELTTTTKLSLERCWKLDPFWDFLIALRGRSLDIQPI